METTQYLDVFKHVFGVTPRKLKESAMTLRFADLVSAHERYDAITQPLQLRHDIQRQSGDLGVLLDLARPYGPPPRKTGELRVVAGPFNQLTSTFGSAGFGGLFVGSDSKVAELKRHLLYAHQIVLPDPLERALALFTSRDEEGDASKRAREELRRFATFVDEVDVAIANGMVCFYSQWELTAVQNAIIARIVADDSVPDDLVHPLAHALHVARYSGSLLADRPEMDEAFNRLLRLPALGKADRAALKVQPDDRKVLQYLASANLPPLDSLTFRDIVLAKQSTQYAEWSEGLRNAVKHIDETADSSLDAYLVQAALEGGAASLQKELERVDPIQAVKDRFIPFGLGAVLALATGAGAAAVAATAAAPAIAALYQLFKDYGKHQKLVALSRHYAVWAPNSGAARA